MVTTATPLVTIDRHELTELIEDGYLTVKRHPTLDLELLDYTQKTQGQGYWNDLTEACRGLVIDRAGTVVSRPFRKFHHWTQITMPAEPPLVYDKLDGSMILVSRHQGEPLVSSRSSFTSEHAAEAGRLLADVGWEPEHGFTYCFELIHPRFQIVCNYGARTELVLLAKIETDTGHEERLEQVADWPGATAEAVTIAWPLLDPDAYAAPDKEGFVLVWPDRGLRAKVKFSEYVRLHGLLTGISAKDIWRLLREGRDLDELRANVPDEFLAWVDEQEQRLRRRFRETELMVDQDFSSFSARYPERRDFAQAVKNHPYRHILFRMLSGQDYTDAMWRMLEPERSLPFWNRDRVMP